MPLEQLTYAQIAERLGVTSEAARAIAKRNRLPRSNANDGKTLVAIVLEEIRHKPLPARSPRGDQSATHMVTALNASSSSKASSPPSSSVRLVTGRTTSASASAPTEWSPPRTG